MPILLVAVLIIVIVPVIWGLVSVMSVDLRQKLFYKLTPEQVDSIVSQTYLGIAFSGLTHREPNSKLSLTPEAILLTKPNGDTVKIKLNEIKKVSVTRLTSIEIRSADKGIGFVFGNNTAPSAYDFFPAKWMPWGKMTQEEDRKAVAFYLKLKDLQHSTS